MLNLERAYERSRGIGCVRRLAVMDCRILAQKCDMSIAMIVNISMRKRLRQGEGQWLTLFHVCLEALERHWRDTVEASGGQCYRDSAKQLGFEEELILVQETWVDLP